MKFQHILVPVDFSEHSIAALKAAGVLAQQLSGSITLLYVLPPLVVMQGDLGPFAMPPAILPVEPERTEAVNAELKALSVHVPAGVAVNTVVMEAHPWPGICDTAKERAVDMIIIASHGYTGLKRMLLGSTAEQVVRHAHCPVLVVKSFEA